MKLPIHQSALDQAVAYNYQLTSTILWLTNGHDNLVFEVNNKGVGLNSLLEIPHYQRDTYLEEE